MSYTKPRCKECDHLLLYEEPKLLIKRKKITKTGRPYKYTCFETVDGGGGNVGGESISAGLYCPQCNALYQINWDDKDRITRGEKIT